jgi:putative membrane protein
MYRPPMTTTENWEQTLPYRDNRLLHFLSVTYAAVWLALAISPADRLDWLLENCIVFTFWAMLLWSFPRFQFSDVSYVLLFIFMLLHAIGAHYAYSNVPLGEFVRFKFGWLRNDYDRWTHFSYGILCSYPLREAALRIAPMSSFWASFTSVNLISSTSALYEILEAWVAKVVNPILGAEYLGSQGDSWDTQNDMACAIFGSCVTMAFTAWLRVRRRRAILR